jgi:hypothetical protein
MRTNVACPAAQTAMDDAFLRMIERIADGAGPDHAGGGLEPLDQAVVELRHRLRHAANSSSVCARFPPSAGRCRPPAPGRARGDSSSSRPATSFAGSPPKPVSAFRSGPRPTANPCPCPVLSGRRGNAILPVSSTLRPALQAALGRLAQAHPQEVFRGASCRPIVVRSPPGPPARRRRCAAIAGHARRRAWDAWERRRSSSRWSVVDPACVVAVWMTHTLHRMRRLREDVSGWRAWRRYVRHS